MKNILKYLAAAAVLTSSVIAVAAPPKLMLLPDKSWCISKGYITESTRNGKTVKDENFDEALYDNDFVNVKTAIHGIMQENNFPLVDAAAQNESDDEDEMFDEAFEGAETGSGVKTNAYDELLKRNKPDITLKVGWNVNPAGMNYSADYRIEAIDSYSNKAVASVAGQTGLVPRSVPLSAAIKKTASNNMDDFLTKLQAHFNDLQDNGREVMVDIRIVDNGAGLSFSKDFGDKELSEVIYEWMSDNTVNHQFSERSAGRTLLRYDQVRIPMFDPSGRPMQVSQFIKQLQRYLKAAPYKIKAEDRSTGLGRGRLYLGEK